MTETKYYRKDWFIALLIGLLFAVAVLSHSDLLQQVELTGYDVGVRLTHRPLGAGDQIAIVAIDDQSIGDIGPWPWPRNVLAEGLDRLSKAQPRAVGVLLPLTETQLDPGLTSIRDIRDRLGDMAIPKQARPQFGELRKLLTQAEKDLDTDRTLSQVLRTTPRLHLPMYLEAQRGTKPPEYIQRYRFAHVSTFSAEARPTPVAGLRVPIEQFGRHASGIGHLSFAFDEDDAVRTMQVAAEYDGHYYPSLPILLAASALNLDARSLDYDIGRGVTLGKLFVPSDAQAQTYVGFYAPAPGKERAFPIYAFSDLRSEKLAASLFTNKVVLIGLTANNLGSTYLTPLTRTNNNLLSEPELTANFVTSILNEDFYLRPEWNVWAEPSIALAVLLYLMFALPRIGGKTAILTTLLLLIGLLGAEQFLMVTQKLWLQTTGAALLLFAGHLAISTKRFVLGERGKAESDSAHTNRMLGLSLQSQGQLDMAMDKFRKLPVDESVLDLIYNVALDFERKRQFHKAAAAYDYILDHRRSFRDCVERKKRASQGDQTIVLGKTLILDGAEKPTLGRYLIEKELGRGEMGIVYLGRDPKINRRVAIKTMALSPEMESKDLGNLRERFYREAETAGRLHHPNIVTIYDVGEEHDLAYIAMEYLEGKELATYISRDKPLPFDWILDVSLKIADALAYAHRNDVVHRDIKPSNIVYDEATGSVKVMDFGIARIIAANRTKTGLVLGTPSYMSPEQISGKRVDGRSDLFSFGCTLFELVTGDTPFGGDTFAALTHQIINAPAPDIRKFRPDTPTALITIVKRLLQKQVTKRYQSGDELRQALDQCRNRLTDTTAKGA